MKKLAAILIACCILPVSGLWAQAHLDDAKALLKQGKAKEAIGVFRKVLETSPKSADAWSSLGEAYWKISNLDSAKIAAQQVISLDEKNVDGYLLLAKVAEAQKDLKSAFSALSSGLVEKKGDGRLLIALGGLLLQADSVDRAIVVLTQAKESSPNSAVLYDGLGDAYYRQGVPAFAITQYEKSVELDSMNAEVYSKLAKLYYKERRYNDAASAYARVVVLDPSNQDALLELSRMYLNSRPRLYSDAAKYLKIYVQRFPKADSAWAMYAETLFYLHQFAEAADAAQRVLKNDPNNGKVLRYAATSQFFLKKYKECIDSYKKLQAVDSLKTDDLLRLADSYYLMKQKELAIATYEQVLQADPSQGEVYYRIGMLLMTTAPPDYEKAAVMFERRFMLDTTSRALNAYLNYAACKIAIREFDSARVAYRTFISKKADDPAAWFGLARALLLQSPDSLQTARKAYEEWLKLIPSSEEAKYKKELAEAYKNIGVAFLVDKKYEQAVAPLRKSLQYNDNDAETHLRLAQSCALSNNKEEAIKEYQRALKLDPKNKDAKKGLELMGIPVD